MLPSESLFLPPVEDENNRSIGFLPGNSMKNATQILYSVPQVQGHVCDLLTYLL
jgi:hypothetical protein